VVAGLIFNNQGKILVALRPPHVPQGNLWEFPGGKVEAGETGEQALKRELKEEVGITVIAAKPFQQYVHQYPDKKLFLDVWHVEKFSGEACARESQQIVTWVSLSELKQLNFPEANHSLILALQDYLDD